MNSPSCYGIRLVNPFLGTLQVVHTEDARAMSRDGQNWEIQILVRTRSAADWGSLNRRSDRPRYYRYAFWNPLHGLRRMPVDPNLDAVSLQTRAACLVEQLSGELLHRLPFPLQDHFELWLLDTQNQPLAMLGSTDDETRMAWCREQRWQAVSTIQTIDDYSPREAEPFERLIRQRAAMRQWFRRSPNGEGVGLDRLCPVRLADRVLPATRFPQLLVRDDWGETKAEQLTREWADRLAPWLLQLPGLDKVRRSSLEQAAGRQPQMVEAMHRLYPEVIDRQRLRISRVAARIQQASG